MSIGSFLGRAHAATAMRAGDRGSEALDVRVGGDLRGAHEQGVGEGRIVRVPAGQGQSRQDTRIEERGMDLDRVRHPDGELVEVGAGVDPRHPHPGQGCLQPPGGRGAARGDVAQPVRAERRQVDRGRERAQRLVGADIAGGPVPSDVLLPRPERHDVRAATVDVEGPARPAGRGPAG